MKYYLFTFKPLSKITGIPNSQSIFGMLCYRYAEKYGQEELEEMLLRQYNGNPDFIISSFFISDLLPLPMDITIPHEKELSMEKLIKLKQLKKVRHISKSIFKEYLKSSSEFIEKYSSNVFDEKYVVVQNKYLVTKEEGEKFNYEFFKKDMQIRNLVGRENMSKQLFYNELMYCRDDLTFDCYILIRADNEKHKLIDLISNLEYVSIGSGKSIGYNLYSCIGYKEEEYVNNNPTKTLLSMSAIDMDINFEKSNYRLKTLHNKVNNARKQVYKDTITVLEEGSSLWTTKNYTGHIAKSTIDGLPRYSNYLGLLI